MKKRYLVIPAAMILGVGLYIGSRCSMQSTDRAELSMRAKNFVRRLNRRDYASCFESFDAKMQSSMGVEQMRATFDPILDTLGEFVEFRGATVTMRDTDGPEYYRCALHCDYSEGPAIITILFNRMMEVAGVYIK